MTGEINLINLGNKKAAKVEHNLAADVFTPRLMKQLAAGLDVGMGWMNDPKYRFLLVRKRDKNLGVVFFEHEGLHLVSLHIAVKTEYQGKYSDDVARLALRWFKHHPTIMLLQVKIPVKSRHAVKFARRQGFIGDEATTEDSPAGPLITLYRPAKAPLPRPLKAPTT